MIRAATFKLGRYFGIVMMMESALLCLSAIMFAGTADTGAQLRTSEHRTRHIALVLCQHQNMRVFLYPLHVRVF